MVAGALGDWSHSGGLSIFPASRPVPGRCTVIRPHVIFPAFPIHADERTRTLPKVATKQTNGGATTGYEAELWGMADALRGSMDAAEYKHVVLGLVFLKYISDAFEERRREVLADWGEEAAEDRDEYIAENIFWVPAEARWGRLKAEARQPTIGQTVDRAMTAIERDNPVLKEVLPKDYARPALDKQRLGQLIDMVGNIQVGDAEARSKDVLGRVYEYFLSQFASAEGKKGGEFYTPRCVVRLLVEMLEPYRGRVYDPCCGSSGMFVQSVEFIRAHATGNANGGNARGDISIYGQESNYTTWRLAKMNLAIRGIGGQIAHGDSFHNDRHPDLKADFILATRPSTSRTGAASGWPGTSAGSTACRRRATPTSLGCSTWSITSRRRVLRGSCWPTGRCRRASPARARSVRTCSRQSLWTAWSRYRANSSIRPRSPRACGFWRAGADGVERFCSSTRGSSAAWWIVRTANSPMKTSRGSGIPTLLAGHRRRKRLRRCSGFCKSASLDEVRKHGHVLTPGRYVGVEPQEDDGEPFEDKMKRLVAELSEQQAEAARLDRAITENLRALGYGGTGR